MPSMSDSRTQWLLAPDPAIAPSAAWPARLAALVPALVLLNPVLIWPLLYAEPQTGPSVLGSVPGAYTTFLLHKVWFPPLLAITGLLFLLSNPTLRSLRHRPLMWWGLFFGWSLLSVSWAIVPEIALSRLVLQVLIASVLLLAFATSRNRSAILDAIFWVIVLTTLFNVLAVLSRPPGPIGHEGIYNHKNGLGAFAAMAILIAFLRWPGASRATRITALMVIGLCVVLLVESQSKTSAGFLPAALAIGIACAFLARVARMSAAIVFLAGLFCGGLAIMLADAVFGLTPAHLAELVVGDPTFTGRTYLWSFAWDHVVERPWLGHGFRSFWDIGSASPNAAMGMGFVASATEGHSGYLDIVLHGGIIALVLFLPILWIGLDGAGRVARHGFAEGAMLLALMVFFILHNLLETSFFYAANMLFVLFQIVWLMILFATIERCRIARRVTVEAAP